MENHIKVKNISVLLVFYVLGYISNILVLHWQDIDIYSLLSSLNQDTVVEEIEEAEECTIPVELEPQIEVIPDLCPVLVDISGAVSTPGVYCFEKGSSFIDAVKKANGFLPDAGFKYISMKMNLATTMVDNSKIYIPFETDYNCNLLTFSLPKEVVDITIPQLPNDEDQESPEGDSECISINNGSQEQLETLDGVGPSTALKIIQGRPYMVLKDLLNVSGIGEATFNKFKESICL